MNNIIYLKASTTYTPEQALNDSLTSYLKDVLIIGYDADGILVVRSSRMTCADAVFLAEHAKNWALSGGVS